MKRVSVFFLALLLLLTGCQTTKTAGEPAAPNPSPVTAEQTAVPAADTQILLSDGGITVNGETISRDPAQAVYAANDIVYYPSGQDFTFGEGTDADAHDASEADRHTVVHISQPGTYALSGTLSAGQIAVDLGEDAENDPEAVVTLVLNGLDITCAVAPAVIFYSVYECGGDEAAAIVDTAAAGANIFLADGSENTVRGSYVARIYKPGSVELSQDGTRVEDAKKLHKYDGAFYSKMSMNIDGNDGILNIIAENEGLDSELHLTINGGDIRIVSGNDGINTNEDGVSVTTINGGRLDICVTGSTGEGDGIDSNGWLVINGGYVRAAACSFSGDAGIDSGMGIYINGGTVVATGNMLDHIAGGEQTWAVFQFSSPQTGGSTYTLRGSASELTFTPENDFTFLVLAGDALVPGDYGFYCGEAQLAAFAGQGFGSMGGTPPQDGTGHPGDGEKTPRENMDTQENGMMPPEGFPLPEHGEKTPPDGMDIPENSKTPPDGIPGNIDIPEAGRGFGNGRGQAAQETDLSPVFAIQQGGNYFSAVAALSPENSSL